MKKEIICLRCGACCISLDGKDCKHLIRFPNGKTACRIYYRRKTPFKVFHNDGTFHFCFNREDTARAGNIYPNCPYNVLAPAESQYKKNTEQR